MKQNVEFLLFSSSLHFETPKLMARSLSVAALHPWVSQFSSGGRFAWRGRTHHFDAILLSSASFDLGDSVYVAVLREKDRCSIKQNK